VVVDDLSVDPSGPTAGEHRPDLLAGVTVVRARGRAGAHVPRGSPYRPADEAVPGDAQDVDITAIPYFAWANRGVAPMRVWLARSSPSVKGLAAGSIKG
jgi:DUF1680 family protein